MFGDLSIRYAALSRKRSGKKLLIVQDGPSKTKFTLGGAESGILGNPRPDHTPKETGHIKNDVGQSNEVVVDFRRSWPGQHVLEEFRELTRQRLSYLRGLSDEGFLTETQTPLGRARLRNS
ncbi:MAG: hypothetical protein Ct9H300mP11_04030 [Chloroflexota bacterium]|nr:MAG: hypothetical protein Ct9H300mP11_04030 [Chloroflexota bacterium]